MENLYLENPPLAVKLDIFLFYVRRIRCLFSQLERVELCVLERELEFNGFSFQLGQIAARLPLRRKPQLVYAPVALRRIG